MCISPAARGNCGYLSCYMNDGISDRVAGKICQATGQRCIVGEKAPPTLGDGIHGRYINYRNRGVTRDRVGSREVSRPEEVQDTEGESQCMAGHEDMAAREDAG